MNKKLIVANWKMLPESLAEAESILEFTDSQLSTLGNQDKLSLVICPPFIYLEDVARIFKTSNLENRASIGAQDIAIEEKTALTGEISGSMLSKIGVQYVIIGHSERRWKLGESDETVNQKLKSALRSGLIPIVCIGERVRDENFSTFLRNQTSNTFKDLTPDEIGKCILAYEPVWAISTNPGAKPDTPQSALESISIIKTSISPQLVLYGGSINPKNAQDFLCMEDIDGVLVGGASVKKEEFADILKIAAKI